MAVPHEITLVAFCSVGTDCGNRIMVSDIVETSRRFAPGFMRRWYRDADVIEVAACPPKTHPENWRLYSRTIFRHYG